MGGARYKAHAYMHAYIHAYTHTYMFIIYIYISIPVQPYFKNICSVIYLISGCTV